MGFGDLVFGDLVFGKLGFGDLGFSEMVRNRRTHHQASAAPSMWSI